MAAGKDIEGTWWRMMSGQSQVLTLPQRNVDAALQVLRICCSPMGEQNEKRSSGALLLFFLALPELPPRHHHVLPDPGLSPSHRPPGEMAGFASPGNRSNLRMCFWDGNAELF